MTSRPNSTPDYTNPNPDLQDGRPRWIKKPNGEIRWETSEASLARAWGDSSMSKLDLIHFGRDKPRTMEEATSALPLALGSSRQYPVWPLTETKAAEAAAEADWCASATRCGRPWPNYRTLTTKQAHPTSTPRQQGNYKELTPQRQENGSFCDRET